MPNLCRSVVLPVLCGSGSVAGDIQDVAQSLHHGVITHRHIQSYLATSLPLPPPLPPLYQSTQQPTKQTRDTV